MTAIDPDNKVHAEKTMTMIPIGMGHTGRRSIGPICPGMTGGAAGIGGVGLIGGVGGVAGGSGVSGAFVMGQPWVFVRRILAARQWGSGQERIGYRRYVRESTG